MKRILLLFAIIGVVPFLCAFGLPENEPASFKEDVLSSSRTKRDVKILKSPRVTNWGSWGEWENCPEGQYIYGMRLKTKKYQGKDVSDGDDTALNGIRFYCDDIGSYKSKRYVSSKEGSDGDFGKEFLCTVPARGFQMRSQNELGNRNWEDDTAANNLRLFCGSQSLEGDGGELGDWTEAQYCEQKQAMCGLRTQVEGVDTDSTGLNNIQVRCCDVKNPAELCEPTSTWDLVLNCDNTEAITTTTCRYVKKTGYSSSKESSQSSSTVWEAYVEVGHTIGASIEIFKASLETKYKAGVQNTYNWTTANKDTWSEEITVSVEVPVPPGIRTQLFQPSATCSLLSVRANDIKRVDFEKSGDRAATLHSDHNHR